MSDAPHLPWPPVIAEARSPFTAVRVAALLLARPRGFGERVAAVADALNAAHTDWLFETRVVADELLQLQQFVRNHARLKEPIGVCRIQRICNCRYALTKAARTRKQERRNAHGGER